MGYSHPGGEGLVEVVRVVEAWSDVVMIQKARAEAVIARAEAATASSHDVAIKFYLLTYL